MKHFRFPHEIQHNIMDCGPTCLRIIARHYGRSFSVPFLRQRSHTGRAGSSLLGISKAAEEIGFHSMAVKISFERLQTEAPMPLIALWNQNHYIVVYKVTSSKVYVSDPANGLLTYSHQEFINQWIKAGATKQSQEGICLLLEPTLAFDEVDIPEAKEEKIDTKSFLVHYMKPHQRLMMEILLMLVVGSLLQLAIPFLTQNIVDIGINTKDLNFIWLVLIAQSMIVLGQMVLELMRSWMMLHVSSRINISLVSDFFIKLMKLPIRYFDTRLSGDMMQRINDQSRIESFLTNTSLNAVYSIFTLLLYGFILAYYNVTLFAIFVAGSTLYMVWILFFMKRREKLDYKRFSQAGATSSKVIELIGGMQEIKLHNAEQQKRWGWERIQVKLYHISLKAMSLEQTQSVGSRIINEIKNIFTTIVAAKLVIDGKLSLGMMLSVTYIIGQLNGPVIQLISVLKDWQDARISLDRLAEIYQKEEENSVHEADKNTAAMAHKSFLPIPKVHNIHLHDLSFRYDDLSPFVLKDINLTIPAGKVTAVVGSSGSGKTTLLKLLMRFYDPSKGEVRVERTDITQTDLYEWRETCGVVMQEGFIFNDTIAGNIAVGDDSPDWDRLNHAATVANIKTFIDTLPLAFNTKIGQEGVGLSGGQKQRLLIARAVYKNPAIIFFDEATSALDANNEKEIMEHFKEFYEGKTVIVMAHRLSTVKDAEKIVVLDGGRIVEEGNHESLVAKKGFYFSLVKNQLQLPD
jgi:ATP-binding cassette, subfamily B, bacterial